MPSPLNRRCIWTIIPQEPNHCYYPAPHTGAGYHYFDTTLENKFSGLLEIEQKGFGFVRTLSLTLNRLPTDPYIAPHLVTQYRLRSGVIVEGTASKSPNGKYQVDTILRINNVRPEKWMRVVDFSQHTVVNPSEHLKLEGPDNNPSMRIVDLIAPIGKGQRGLIVSPPRSGKTMLLQQMAHAISTNYPDVDLIVLLVDERPEEVTDIRRAVKGLVFASSHDDDRMSHTRLAQLSLEYAKRRAEQGRDVVMLLDSITKLGRAFNLTQQSSGRTLSGGVDARALEIPKKIFGAARVLENHGTLTIIATALIETNSRMDELIFQEFKGTGNMELVLSRELSNLRIFPAINIQESGTRREELLFKENTYAYQTLRRAIERKNPVESMKLLLEVIHKTKTNERLLENIQKFT
jgi:transcription termination factor Rho